MSKQPKSKVLIDGSEANRLFLRASAVEGNFLGVDERGQLTGVLLLGPQQFTAKRQGHAKVDPILAEAIASYISQRVEVGHCGHIKVAFPGRPV